MKKSLNEDVKRFQKIAGILNESMDVPMEEAPAQQKVMYDDIAYKVYGTYPDAQTAIQAVKQYLDSGSGPVTFDKWFKHEGEFIPQEGQILFLVGPRERPGQQPPLLVSADDESLEM